MHKLFYEQAVYEISTKRMNASHLKMSSTYSKAILVLHFNDEAKDNDQIKRHILLVKRSDTKRECLYRSKKRRKRTRLILEITCDHKRIRHLYKGNTYFLSFYRCIDTNR